MIDEIVSSIWSFARLIWDFISSIWSIISFFVSLIKVIRYSFTTLITAVWNLIVQVFDWWAFNSLFESIDIISNYIGGPATVFLCTLFFVVLVRIAIAFVLKILKLNIEYHSSWSKTDKLAFEDSKKNSRLFKR